MTANPTHVAAFDGLRGAAVLAVVLFHGFPGQFPGGFLGVDVFFALSGFLITGVVVKEWGRTGRFDFSRFGGRRLLRLAPALGLLLLADLAYAALTGGDVGAHLLDAALIAGGVANWSLALGFDRPGLMAHSWSLAVEMQFYLVWPPLLILALRLTGRRGATALTLGLIFACVAWRVALTLDGAAALRGFEGADTRADGLLIGALLALMLRSDQGQTREPSSWLSANVLADQGLAAIGFAAAVALGLCVAFVEWTDRALYFGGFDLASIAAVTLIAVCLAGRLPGWARVLTWPPLAALGQVSYGLYLWHFPLIWMIAGDPGRARPERVLLALSVALAIATASYLALERPMLARREAAAPARPALGAIR